MPDEEKQVVDEIKEGDSKKHPDSVPYHEYIGIKEKFNKTEDKYKEQVQSLEEKLKGSPSADELKRVTDELEALKSTHQTTLEELNKRVDASLAEKRTALKKILPDAKVETMSEQAITDVLQALGSYKAPLPDMGAGGGGGLPTGSPMEMARMAYTK